MHHPTDAAAINVNSRLKLKRCLLVGVIMSACGCASAPLKPTQLAGPPRGSRPTDSKDAGDSKGSGGKPVSLQSQRQPAITISPRPRCG